MRVRLPDLKVIRRIACSCLGDELRSGSTHGPETRRIYMSMVNHAARAARNFSIGAAISIASRPAFHT
jgi:hypothetical protein